jgi:phage shock protein PspC (stress-responsive transcriptional regulator)
MAEEVKKFYRSRTDRVLFGICGGLGKYFGIDPILFRLLFVLLFLVNGVGLLLYIIMVVVTPEEPGRGEKDKGLEGEVHELADKLEEKAHQLGADVRPEEVKLSDSRSLLGGIIIFFGLFFLMREFIPWFGIDNNVLWSVLIIGVGFYIILKK